MALPRELTTTISSCCFDLPILLLGKVGENYATKVTIDASEWYDDEEEGTFQVLVKRADEELFTASITVSEGIITWLIPASEIGAAGYGEIEVNYTVDEMVAKSARVDTRVFSSLEIDSLTALGTTWAQLVLAAVSDAQSAAEDAEEALANLQDTIDDAVASAIEAAEQAASDASDYKDAASGYADDASASATLAESYAKGGTSSRTGEDTDNAKYYKEQAATSAETATDAKTAAVTARNEAVAAHDEIFDILQNATIINTTETSTLNADGLIATIVHTDNDSGDVVRTDVFTYNGNVVTEVRTDADGNTQTNVYDLDNLTAQYNV